MRSIIGYFLLSIFSSTVFAIDVSGPMQNIADARDAVADVIGAVLLVLVAIKVYRWLRKIL